MYYQSATGGLTNRSNNDPATANQEPSLIEWVYDYMQNRYGIKTIADKKFKQMICSCMKYKDKNARIRMFGRFLELYDNLSQKDFKLYVEI